MKSEAECVGKMQPEISIIVPIYNTEKYLKKCIDSILNQTYRDFELILVDDGSNDNSPKICDEYVQSDSRIKTIHKENAGLPQARKSGVMVSAGKYICFVDSDDWVEYNYLEKLYETMKKNNSDMVCCGIYYDYEDDPHKCGIAKMSEMEKNIGSQECIELLHNLKSVSPNMFNKLFKKEVFIYGDFPKEHTMCEDYFFIVQILYYLKKVTLIPEVLYHYRQSQQSMCGLGYNQTYKVAVYSFARFQDKLLRVCPECYNSVISYRVFHEMSFIGAMAKNNNYIKEDIQYLLQDIRRNFKLYVTNSSVSFFLKCAAVVVCLSPRLFLLVFKIRSVFGVKRTVFWGDNS